jgi:hypothetical protein
MLVPAASVLTHVITIPPSSRKNKINLHSSERKMSCINILYKQLHRARISVTRTQLTNHSLLSPTTNFYQRKKGFIVLTRQLKS